MDSQPQKVSIGNLLMTNESGGERPGSLHKTDLVAPKPMGRTFHYRCNAIIELNCSTHGRMILEQVFDVTTR